MCASLSTVFSARKRLSAWRNEKAECFWAVKLDVRDSGGHLDVTQRAFAGTLSDRGQEATFHVISVGALSVGFRRMLGIVCSKYLLAGLHGCKGSAISVNAFGAFRPAVARSVWSDQLPMTNTPALLSLLDGPCGSGPAFHVIWSRFRYLDVWRIGLRRKVRKCRPSDHASSGLLEMGLFICALTLLQRFGAGAVDPCWLSSTAYGFWASASSL